MDRISDLPDQILTQILSLLPAEEVVRTMILSKRWKCVWASVPILVFDNYDAKFVKCFLDCRENLPLDKFHLEWRGDFSAFLPYGFQILSGMTLFMPKVISICIYTNEYFRLPDSVFTCASVEKMSLEIQWNPHEGDFIEAQSINLPRLKKLELRIVMINNDFIRKLLSGCPVLEKLVFTCSAFDMYEISSPVLKKLTINNCCLFREIEISCPSVRSLYLDTWRDLRITLKNMSSLHTVKFFWFQDDDNHNLKLLNALSNVVNLSVYTCSVVLDKLATDIPNCPTLFNLKNLELGKLKMNLQRKLLVSLLQRSPNLKTLTLRFCQPSPSEDDTEPAELLGDASFLLEYLETVKLKFEFSIYEFKNLKEFKEEVVPYFAFACKVHRRNYYLVIMLISRHVLGMFVDCLDNMLQQDSKIAPEMAEMLFALLKTIGQIVVM